MGILTEEKEIIPLHCPRFQEMLFFFLSGMVVSVPITLYTGTLTNQLCLYVPLFYAQICSVAIFTPLVEEFAKAYPLIYRHGETERSILTLGFLVGLGFGLSEFLVYTAQRGVPIPIRLPGVFFHAASTSITSFGIAKKRVLPYYSVSVALHFLNNFMALLGFLWYFGVIGSSIISYLIALRLYNKTSRKFVD